MKTRILIALSFLTAFLVTGYAAKNIFLAGTPKVNPFYLSNLKDNMVITRDRIALALANPFKRSSSNTASIPEEFFKSVSTGVSAYEKSKDEVYLKIDKGTNYKIKQIKLKNGTVLNAIDLTQ